MSKHTPGPWTHYDDTTPAGKTGRHEIVAMGRTVARIYYADERASYDARLIAAAPDLLTEASFLLDRLAELEIPEELARDWCGHAEPSIERLRRIIAKATGNPPSD